MTLGDEARGRGGGEESAHLSEIKGINKRSDRERTGEEVGMGRGTKQRKQLLQMHVWAACVRSLALSLHSQNPC